MQDNSTMNYPELERLIDVIKKLRDPISGCPWDLKQDLQSLKKYAIEEAYEYVHAIDSEDNEKIKSELGDLLLQVVLNSQVAQDQNKFNIENVAKTIADKMIYRHPHVFNNPTGRAHSNEEIVENWEKLKGKEKKTTYYFNIDETYLPALMAANKIGQKSTQVNFDWENFSQVMYKVEEEWQEVKAELPIGDETAINKERAEEEIGDLLFSIAQLARHLKIDPEHCLTKANQKFIKRFNKMEDLAKQEGIELKNKSNSELEELWQKVKK
jgi:MazG family protein